MTSQRYTLERQATGWLWSSLGSKFCTFGLMKPITSTFRLCVYGRSTAGSHAFNCCCRMVWYWTDWCVYQCLSIALTVCSVVYMNERSVDHSLAAVGRLTSRCKILLLSVITPLKNSTGLALWSSNSLLTLFSSFRIDLRYTRYSLFCGVLYIWYSNSAVYFSHYL
jgi:hypothetical protein